MGPETKVTNREGRRLALIARNDAVLEELNAIVVGAVAKLKRELAVELSDELAASVTAPLELHVAVCKTNLQRAKDVLATQATVWMGRQFEEAEAAIGELEKAVELMRASTEVPTCGREH